MATHPKDEPRSHMARAIADGLFEDNDGGGPVHSWKRRYTQLKYADLIATKKRIGPREHRTRRTTCVSKGGIERPAHELDRDGVCYWCSQAGRGLEE